MRTTLTLDPDVAVRLKRLRQRRDVPLKDIVNDALRESLLIDANILIYASDCDSPQHAKAHDWLEDRLNGSARVGLPWSCLLASYASSPIRAS